MRIEDENTPHHHGDCIFHRLSINCNFSVMKAEHLRKGNWVNVYGIPERITTAMIDKVDQINEKGKKIIDLSYIPLTEEILVKAGFVGSAEKNYIFKGFEIGYITTDDNFQFEFGFTELSIVNIKSVHQLQNLYFALTGEELNIEL